MMRALRIHRKEPPLRTGIAVIAGIWRAIPRIALTMLLVLIALAGYLLLDHKVVSFKKNAYFYDMTGGTVFVAEDQLPPMALGGGNEAVRAYLFTCGNCTPDEWFVGRLETYENSIHDALHLRVATPVPPGQTPAWKAAFHPSSAEVTKSLLGRCGGAKPIRCDPGRIIDLPLLPGHAPGAGETIAMGKSGKHASPKAGSVLSAFTSLFSSSPHDPMPDDLPCNGPDHHWARRTALRLAH